MATKFKSIIAFAVVSITLGVVFTGLKYFSKSHLEYS